MGLTMYKIGICDDDRVLCAALEEQLCTLAEELALKAEVEVWYTGEELQRDLGGGLRLDLLFLDIELVRKDGIEVGFFIRGELEDMQTHIVYISAKQDYAMRLFKVQPLDFLLKPIKLEELREVFGRSIRQKRAASVYFSYQKGGSLQRIALSEICYFMSRDKKILMVSKDATEEFYGKLKEIAGRLPAGFMPIHQSYIVNRDYIDSYTYESVTLADGEQLPISKPYRKKVREAIRQERRARTDVSL